MILKGLIRLMSFLALVDGETVFQVLPLPYSYKALEPSLSRETLETHHDGHFRKYVHMVNAMIKSIERLQGSSLDEIMLDSYRWNKPLFNNAAQSWNHDFYFKCMTPNYRSPSESLIETISKDFESFEAFQKEFVKAGVAIFGSGWAWLVFDAYNDKLFVTQTVGADNPLVHNEQHTPILTMDVWEHAYYLDYQSRRGEYAESFLESLVDWKFVEENLTKARSKLKLKQKKEEEDSEVAEAIGDVDTD